MGTPCRIDIRRFPWAGRVLLLAGVVLAGACGRGESTDATAAPSGIVERHATAAFEVQFELPRDRPHLERFLSECRDARTRQDLIEAWRPIWAAVTAPSAPRQDFLEVQVFARALADPQWPPGRPPDKEASFVDGTLQALESFLGEKST